MVYGAAPQRPFSPVLRNKDPGTSMAGTLRADITIKGLDELLRKMDGKKMAGNPVRSMMTNSVNRVKENVVERTPRASGELRGSFRTKVAFGLLPLWAKVFSTSDHAIFVEKGTKPHWTNWRPGSPLYAWARRKGITPFLVARAIAQRGTEGAHMMEEGLKASMSYIRSQERRMARDIEKMWNRR